MKDTVTVSINVDAVESLEDKILSMQVSPGLYAQGMADGIKMALDCLGIHGVDFKSK